MKRTVQRLLPLLLALCLILSLAACAKQAAEAPKAGESKTDPGAPGSPDVPVLPDAPAEFNGGEAPGSDYKSEVFYAGTASEDGGFAYSKKTAGSGADGEAAPAAPPAPGGESDDVVLPGTVPQIPAEPLKLTAAEWKDNDNWPFFINLVNNETIAFPSFGLDPRNRLEVRVQKEDGSPLANEIVTLADTEGNPLWKCRSDKKGVAYVFWAEGQTPDRVICGTADAPVQIPEPAGDPQGNARLRPAESVTLTLDADLRAQAGMQIMFIVDTTGSMGDEIAYLQKDFSAIAERVGSEGVHWSVNFYRDQEDEYVTRTNGFSSDVAELQAKINAEYADGGGDTPEAVAEILTACLIDQTEWEENTVKLAFLIFDAPPHDGKEAALEAAVRAAAEKGIHLIPVVASNAERDTELFGRAIAILTGGTYVFLTDDSGIGDSHLEPIVGSYEVELLQDLIVRIIDENRP